MSQRLLISKRENINYEGDLFYDCIYSENSNYMNLLADWCCYDFFSCTYAGPWKITVRDNDFFDKFMEDFKKLSYFISELKSIDDIWFIYDERNDKILHEGPAISDHYNTIVEKLFENETTIQPERLNPEDSKE